MALWDLAIVFTVDGEEDFPKAIGQWIGVEGGGPGAITEGFASFDKALAKLMNDGYEPFSAHRYEDFSGYGPRRPTVPPVPSRDYVWFRKPVKRSQASRLRPGIGTTAKTRPPK
jgi:hypothetical protein